MSALLELEKRLQNTNALIVQYQDALALPDNREYQNAITVTLHSLQKLQKRLETEFLELASLQRQEIYRYRLTDAGDKPSLGGIGEAWGKFEKGIFSNLFKTHESRNAADSWLQLLFPGISRCCRHIAQHPTAKCCSACG